MKTLALLGVAISLVGCGGNSTPTDQLQGSWITDADSVTGCSNGVNVVGSNMQLLTICSLQRGGVGVDVAEGPFVVSGSTIALTLTQASCPASDFASGKMISLNFSVTGSNLAIGGAGGVVALRRNPPSTGTVVVKFGCWDTSTVPLTFTPMPIGPI